MGFDINLTQELKPELKQILAPHIFQSLEILTLPILDLNKYLQKELEENPVLEIDDEKEGLKEKELLKMGEETIKEEKKEIEDEDMPNFDIYYYEPERSQSVSSKLSLDDEDPKRAALENTPKPLTLQDYLLEQLRWEDIPENVNKIAKEIIFNLDSKGYLRYSLRDIIKSMEGKYTLEEAKQALKCVQRLDPPGIGAKDVKECLLLQLDKKDPDYKLAKLLIKKYLKDINENKYPKIAKELKKDIKEIKRVCDKIKKLDPTPGASYSAVTSPPIVPDVTVKEVDGEYIVILEDEKYIPNLKINGSYKELMEKNKEAKEFLKKKYDTASRIIEAIKQRQDTLRKVVLEIVKRQKEFLEYGIDYLKPLKMTDVAESLNMHVSTISRAISNKYIQTPRGIFPLKFFFQGGVGESRSEESIISIKEKIKEIIDNEDKKDPLSDEEIKEKLKEKYGIDLARRTISKYRKALNIPSSRQRKEY